MNTKLKKLTALLLVALMIVSLLAGCGSKTESKQEEVKKEEVKEEVKEEANSKEPAEEVEKVLRVASVYDFKSCAETKTLVFECLLQSDMAGNVTPWLAESYDVSKEGMVHTFKLREGITYSDGTPFNAETAKLSLDTACATATMGKYVESVNIIDEYTVEIVLHTYLYDLPLNLSDSGTAPMICEADLNEEGKCVGFIGTGPFIFLEDTYEKNVGADLIRNENYWDGEIALDRVSIVNITDPYSQVVALESGAVDIIGIAEHHSSIPYVQIAALKAAGYTVQCDETGRYQVLEYNCSKAPFDDANVRMAFNLALNREEMVESLFEGLSEASNVITAPWYVLGPDNIDVDYYKYDLARANQLLDEAGWIDSDGDGVREKNGEKLSVVIIAPNGEANGDSVCVYAQSELAKIGAEVEVKQLESSAAGELKNAADYNMYLHHSFCMPTVPAGLNLGSGSKYHSDSSSWAYSFHSEKLDAMLEAAFTNPDDASREGQIDEIWTYMHEQAVTMPLYSVKKLVAMTPNVTGYELGRNMFDMSMIKDMDIDMSK